MGAIITDIKETQRIIGTYLKPNYTPQLGKSKKKWIIFLLYTIH